ncbi:MAG: glycosyltransferase [Sedimentisphaerales bacterium]
MVIVKLYGGLGNQLFQYAMARRMAVESPEDIAGLRYVKEKHFHFDPEILDLRDGVYLDGYWQSEKYFKPVEGIIREELAVREPLQGANLRIAEEMAQTNSVCVHFRKLYGVSCGQVDTRGVNIHGSVPLDYYYRCIERLTQTIKNPHFFVFSDDPGWARDNLKLPYPTTVVANNGPGKDYEDLRLMSLCKHYIIANSTFSWWGAWLNPEKDKMVFAPGQWFNAAEHNVKDLIPETWTKISVPKPPAADLAKYGRFISYGLYQEIQSNLNQTSGHSIKISVIVPCYNHAGYLPEAVESLVRQTYTNWECIIVNDGSSDNTVAVANQLIARYPDRRIRFIDKPHSGVSDTRNVGIEVAAGQWILPLDSDDMFEPSFMQRAVDIVSREPKVDIVFSNMQEFGASHGQWMPDEYSRKQVMVTDTMPYASLYRKELWHKVGGYNKPLSIIKQPEDWSFWISCSKHNVVVRRIQEKLFLYRVHPQSTYLTAIKPNRRLAWAFVATCHPDLYSPQALVEAWRLISDCPDDVYARIIEAAEICPNSGLPHFWRALAERKRGQSEEAIKHCLEAVEKARKNDWQAIFVLMNWQKKNGELVSSAESLEELLTIRPDFAWARDMLPTVAQENMRDEQSTRSGTRRILFYFDRIGNLDQTSPAGTVISVFNLARILQAHWSGVEIHITGNLVSRTEQYESFRIFPPPSADKRTQFLAEYDVVFFATHIRWFKETPKRPGQIWFIHQHCWDFDDESRPRIEDVDAVICLSEYHKAFLKSRGIAAEKLVIIPNLIDTDKYRPGNVHRDDHSIMFAGGIHPHKGVHLLFDAFQLVHQQMPDLTLHLYGDGAMWRGGDDYGNYLKSMKPQGVHFHGYIDHSQMPEIYSKHGILSLPSVLESFGLVTVEAQACGCIPVVHKVGGVAATLADGLTGFLYEPNTPQRLAETILKAMRTVDADPSFRQRTVDFARDRFSMTKADHYISALEDRINRVRPAGALKGVVGRNTQDFQADTGEPLVSVVMPVYNGADYIGQAVDSVLSQDYSNLELVVIDDGSTDNTRQIVLDHNDKRIKYLHQANKGVSSARNLGLHQAKGQYIIPLDADDMMAPACITKHLAEFKKHPEADLVYSDVLLIDESGRPLRPMKKPEYSDRRHLIRDLFRAGHPIVPFRLGIKRSVFDKIGFYDESLLVGEDYDMMRRFAKAELVAHHLGEALHLRRVQSNSLTRTHTAHKARCHFDVVRRFLETFSCDELFPDVTWDETPYSRREVHAKCLIVGTYLAMGQDFSKSNSPHIYVRMAFEEACSQLRKCVKIDPDNRTIRRLLEKCERGKHNYSQEEPRKSSPLAVAVPRPAIANAHRTMVLNGDTVDASANK